MEPAFDSSVLFLPQPRPLASADLLQLGRDFHAGWFLGDRERLEAVLHPGLSRYLRGRTHWPTAARDGAPPQVEVLDAFGNLACLRLRGAFGKVMLQAIRYGRRWRVVNLMADPGRAA